MARSKFVIHCRERSHVLWRCQNDAICIWTDNLDCAMRFDSRRAATIEVAKLILRLAPVGEYDIVRDFTIESVTAAKRRLKQRIVA